VVIPVHGIEDAVDLSVGMDFACAVRAGGRVTCWGSNERGQLGNPDSKDALLPRWVDDEFVASSVDCGAMHTCAMDVRGRPWCWGQNFASQLGDGTRQTRRDPTMVSVPE
jgi:alpha-tubulin suppressor-like RCC1 family protein